MFRSFRVVSRVLFLGVALGAAAPLSGQLTEGILSPAGRLRLELLPEFDFWSRRFGVHVENGAPVSVVEPLGYDLEHAPVSVAALQRNLRDALANQSVTLTLGATHALVSRDRTRMGLGAALGVFDWLTVGGTVPFIRNLTEVAFDYRSTPSENVGLNPRFTGDPRVAPFLSGLGTSRTALAAQVAQRCPAAPDCAALTDLLGRYAVFESGLRQAYEGSPLFVTAASPLGLLLQARLTALGAEITQRAPTVPLPGTAPLATAPLDQLGLRTVLTDAAGPYQLAQPFESSYGDWQLGDIELTVAVRLLQGEVRDSSGGPDRVSYEVGARGLVRLPTGNPEDPSLPLDVGSGDGQTDLEGGTFADLRWSKVGVRAEARYGVQGAADVQRRIAPPDEVFAPAVTLTTVTWTPGNYFTFEAEPSWYLADEFAVGGSYRFWSKGADSYHLVGSTQDDAASVLGLETEETLHEVGLGLAFSTLDGWREGRAAHPFEVRVAVHRGISGSGGAVPKGTRIEATGRVFWRLWGTDPERVPEP